MASVVWLMYLADVAHGVSTTLCIAAFCVLVVVGVYKLASCIEDFEAKPVKAYVVAAIAAVLVADLIPGQTTIYAAAAVAAGDKALQTETGSKAVRALNAWLDEQIAKAGNEKKN